MLDAAPAGHALNHAAEDPVRRACRGRLRAAPFDVLVIGGGITGAGVALDAAARGLSVALVEQGDFAGGTSSRSTKLVHGGLRYLPLGDLRQVREDLAERERLLRNAPHLVRPLPFVLPLYADARRPLGIGLPRMLSAIAPLGVSAGLWAYDRLAGRLSSRPHRTLSRDAARSLLPAMRLDGLRRAYLYYDAETDDARLVIAVLRAAQARGAVALNYARAVELVQRDSRIAGARVVDLPSGEEVTVSARTTVNATGVWAEEVAALAGPPRFHLRRAKGAHLVVRADRLRLGRAALVLPETDDGRVAFVVPWQGAALIGTTDTEWTGPASAEPAADQADVSYLLDHAARFLTVRLAPADIVSVYAGLRPLLAPSAGGRGTARLSRRHEIYAGPAGLVTIAGGKLTTYRRMAEDTVNHVLGRPGGTPSPTRDLALDGAEGFMRAIPSLRARARRSGVSDRTLRHLLRAYGTRAARVLELIEERPALLAPIAAGHPYVAAEAVLAARDEMAVSVEDVLFRRTRLGHLLPDQGRGAAPVVAALMGEAMRWPPGAVSAQIDAYRRAAAALALPAPAGQETPAPP
ncbi:MAG: glycerol-3-phosphate dehydrogenase/oxidase [bacterium]